MEIKLTLALPRDGLSVPVVRRVLSTSLHSLGVTAEVVSDIEVALTEACTNVLDHVADGEEYEVSAGINGSECLIEVRDAGSGFDHAQHGFAEAAASAEGGRGIQLMRALVDRVQFESVPGDGTIVHLEKRLTWRPGSPIALMHESTAVTRNGPWSDAERQERRLDEQLDGVAPTPV
ncbi:MAG: ATP-binding protein [Mycobacteriales bacterium]|nr:ATP-binding protein [Mycobacteriales bacterium]